MDEAETIIQCVNWGSKLSLALWDLAATAPSAAKDVIRVAKCVSLFSLTLKRVGATIKNDDRVPSPEALKSLQDVLLQCKGIFKEIEVTVPVVQDKRRSNYVLCEENGAETEKWEFGLVSKAKVEYLMKHLDSLESTLSLMLQSLYTVKVVEWTLKHEDSAKDAAEDNVKIEKMQMESLIIEQQLSILQAFKIHDEFKRSEAFGENKRLSQNGDGGARRFFEPNEGSFKDPSPEDLVPYQDASLNKTDRNASDCRRLDIVMRTSTSFVDEVLLRWTRLREFERKKTHQATVESDSEDDASLTSGQSKTGRYTASPASQRPHSRQSSLQPTTPVDSSFAIPTAAHAAYNEPLRSYSPQPPSAPYPASPTLSHRSLGRSPVTPSATFPGALPSHAVAAAVSAEEDDGNDENSLGIPWRLCLMHSRWEFIDSKVVDSNTSNSPKTAATNENAWTEIAASWVSEEALAQSGYKYSPAPTEKRDSKRSKQGQTFMIEQPLSFREVEALVERTIKLYRNPKMSRVPKELKEHRVSAENSLRPPRPVSQLERSYSSPASAAPSMSPYMIPATATAAAAAIPGVSATDHFHAPKHGATRRSNLSYHTTPETTGSDTDSGPDGDARRRRQSYVRRYRSREGDGGRDRDRNRDRERDRERDRDRDKDRDRKERDRKRAGKATVGTLAKVGGLAVLLDGLADAL